MRQAARTGKNREGSRQGSVAVTRCGVPVVIGRGRNRIGRATVGLQSRSLPIGQVRVVLIKQMFLRGSRAVYRGSGPSRGPISFAPLSSGRD